MGSGDGFPSLIVLDHGDLVIWHPEAVYGIPQHSPREFEKTRHAKAGAAHHWGGPWICGPPAGGPKPGNHQKIRAGGGEASHIPLKDRSF